MPDTTTTVKKRVYSEGASNLRVFKYNRVTGTYATTPFFVEGLINVDITLSQTKDKKAADNKTNYLSRVSPATGDGTIQLMGMSKAMYEALYADIKDANGVVNFGSTEEPQGLGVMYDEIESYVDEAGTRHTSTNRMVLYDCEFAFPTMSAKTLEEGNTDVKEYSLGVTCSSVEKDGRQAVAAIINSVDDKDQFEATKTAMYVLPSDNDIRL